MRFSPLSTSLVMVALAGCPGPTPRPSVVDSSTDLDVPVADAPRDATDVPPADVADVRGDVSDGGASDGDVAAVDVPTAGDAVAADAPDAPADVVSELAIDAPRDSAMDAVADAGPTDALGADAEFGPWTPLGDGPCRPRARRTPQLPGIHVDPDAGAIMWLTNPPSSGPHYGVWARWGAWPSIERGNWVHNLEHGGVAMLYRCPTGTCDSTRDALVTAMNSIPTDPACMPDDASPTRVRVVITRDNEITTPVAAAAWGAVYEAECVDASSLRLFYTTYAGHAPEDFCADGFVP